MPNGGQKTFLIIILAFLFFKYTSARNYDNSYKICSQQDTTLSLVSIDLWIGEEIVDIMKVYTALYKGEIFVANRGLCYMFNINYLGANYSLFCLSKKNNFTTPVTPRLDCIICPEELPDFSDIKVEWVETRDKHVQSNLGLAIDMNLEDVLTIYQRPLSFNSLDSLGGVYAPCTLGTFMPIENNWVAYFTIKQYSDCASSKSLKDYKLSCFKREL